MNPNRTTWVDAIHDSHNTKMNLYTQYYNSKELCKKHVIDLSGVEVYPSHVNMTWGI